MFVFVSVYRVCYYELVSSCYTTKLAKIIFSCGVLVTNGELHQACGHVTMIA